MAKKTFETVVKVSITTNHIKKYLKESLYNEDDLDETFLKKFVKDYDWDSLLNSTKFNRHTLDHIKYSTDPDDVLYSYFCTYNAEYNKIADQYDKLVAELYKPEPTLTVTYNVVLTGTQREIDESYEIINNSTCAESIDKV
jgi:hypothetical protein